MVTLSWPSAMYRPNGFSFWGDIDEMSSKIITILDDACRISTYNYQKLLSCVSVAEAF